MYRTGNLGAPYRPVTLAAQRRIELLLGLQGSVGPRCQRDRISVDCTCLRARRDRSGEPSQSAAPRSSAHHRSLGDRLLFATFDPLNRYSYHASLPRQQKYQHPRHAGVPALHDDFLRSSLADAHLRRSSLHAVKVDNLVSLETESRQIRNR